MVEFIQDLELETSHSHYKMVITLKLFAHLITQLLILHHSVKLFQSALLKVAVG
jgi:hypothetical protein